MILSIMSQAYWKKETTAINKKWTTVDIHSGNVTLQNAFAQNTSITASSGNAEITNLQSTHLSQNKHPAILQPIRLSRLPHWRQGLVQGTYTCIM